MSQYTSDIIKLAGKGYCCSQIIIHLALDMQSEENPALLKAMQGLCEGGGSQHGTCGVLTGAKCLIALYCGKGEDNAIASSDLPLLLEEIQQWFTERTAQLGAITCGAIAPDPQSRFSVCPSLIADTAEKVFTLLMNNEIDITE